MPIDHRWVLRTGALALGLLSLQFSASATGNTPSPLPESGGGSFALPLPALGLSARFDGRGMELAPAVPGAWHWTLRMDAISKGDKTFALGGGGPLGEGRTVRIERGEFTEWFESRPEGEGNEEVVVQSETDRYIAWPGQALGYKVGAMKILELRADAERRLGANFDIRAFHDEILGAGPLPLDILERRIGAWVEAQAAPRTSP